MSTLGDSIDAALNYVDAEFLAPVSAWIDAALSHVDAEYLAPANAWLWAHVSPSGQYLALFVLLLCMALHLVYTKELQNYPLLRQGEFRGDIF